MISIAAPDEAIDVARGQSYHGNPVLHPTNLEHPMGMERILFLYLHAIAEWTFNHLFAILGGTIVIALAVTTCVNRLHLGRIQTRRQLRHEPLRLHIRKF